MEDMSDFKQVLPLAVLLVLTVITNLLLTVVT